MSGKSKKKHEHSLSQTKESKLKKIKKFLVKHPDDPSHKEALEFWSTHDRRPNRASKRKKRHASSSRPFKNQTGPGRA